MLKKVPFVIHQQGYLPQHSSSIPCMLQDTFQTREPCAQTPCVPLCAPPHLLKGFSKTLRAAGCSCPSRQNHPPHFFSLFFFLVFYGIFTSLRQSQVEGAGAALILSQLSSCCCILQLFVCLCHHQDAQESTRVPIPGGINGVWGMDLGTRLRGGLGSSELMLRLILESKWLWFSINRAVVVGVRSWCDLWGWDVFPAHPRCWSS